MHLLKPVQSETKIIFLTISWCKDTDYNHPDGANIS